MPLRKYEAENQAMLEHFGAKSCTVIRNAQAKVVEAWVEYPDGTPELIYHLSPRDVVGPVSVTSSETKAKPEEQSTVLPNSARVTYGGHREVPESEQGPDTTALTHRHTSARIASTQASAAQPQKDTPRSSIPRRSPSRRTVVA
jgi:hypothetical protein